MLTKSILAAALFALMANDATAAMRLVGTKVDQSRASAQSMPLGAPKANPAAHLKNGDRIRIGGLGILQIRNRTAVTPAYTVGGSPVGQRVVRQR